MIAAVATVDGVLLVDAESESLLGPGIELPPGEAPHVDLPRVVAAARAGATIVCVVERRPPLAISRDGGSTWSEAGGGLPAGFAIAVAEDDPDRMLYAGRNRLFLSVNGGVFWRSLPFELPDVEGVAWLDQKNAVSARVPASVGSGGLSAVATLRFEPAVRVRRLARAEEGDSAALALSASYRGERTISISFGALESVRQGPATRVVREACWLLKPWGREGRIELRALRRPTRRTLLEWLEDVDDVTVMAAARRKLVLLPAPDDRERAESTLSPTRRKMLRLADRDGEHCVWCSTYLTYESIHCTLDHIRCRSHGGADALDNLVLACAACNHGRADAPASSWLDACLTAGQDVDVDSVLRAIARSHAHHGRALRRAA